jgi:hypothetical protein
VQAVLVENGIAAEEAARLAARSEGSPGRALAWRATWAAGEHDELRTLLAGLAGGRYGSVLAMSKGLGKTEQETVARLDGLLAGFRDDAAAAIAAGDAAGLAAAVRRGELVAEALTTLRRRNPNRALLSEALALRLARG